MKIDAPTEAQEQSALFEWAGYNVNRCAALQLMFHIPNGGYRTRAEAGRFKAEGVKPGVPDIFLPVARGGKHGLFIEMKRIKGGKVTEAQTAWQCALTFQGYRAEVAYGWQDAAAIITDYLTEGGAGGHAWGL